MVEAIATVPPVGGYLSLSKIVAMLALAMPWLYVAPWVYRDSKRVLAPHHVWPGAVLGAGGLGMILWLWLPWFLVGLLTYVVLVGATLLAYTAYRDGRVDERRRILSASALKSLFGSRGRKAVQIEEKVKVYDHTGKVVFPPSDPKADPDAAQAYNLAQEVLYDIIFRRASHAEFAPHGLNTRVRYVIDGVAVDRPPRELADGEAVAQYLKPIAGLEADEMRRPQEGTLSVDTAAGAVDMYLKTAGTKGGQVMQFRVVQEVVQTKLDELGMSDDVRERIRAHCRADHGLIIVAGRPGSGVTSTLYSLLRDQDAFIKQLVTLEAKQTVDLENITQNVYGEAADLPSALASALRRDPDVVMVDQCPDGKTAELICQAVDAKVVILGLHAAESFTALAKWCKACGDPAAAVKNLRAVLCQMLIRELCQACREEYRPDPQLLAKANLKVRPNSRFFRPPTTSPVDEKGRLIICPACQNTRYVGRTGVFEMLEMTDDVRELVVQGAALSQITAACRKNKMLYMQEQALRKVVAGITSIKEVIRTTQKTKKQ